LQIETPKVESNLQTKCIHVVQYLIFSIKDRFNLCLLFPPKKSLQERNKQCRNNKNSRVLFNPSLFFKGSKYKGESAGEKAENFIARGVTCERYRKKSFYV
jgi:hypothetical protein